MDPYQQQELIEKVSDRLAEDEPGAAIAAIIDAYGLDPYSVAEALEGDEDA